jgi:RNA polymerase primary sigma factor
MANQNFVRSIARRYKREGIDMEDLVGEGMVGLMDAALRFDPERGIKFITYGVWWIKRSVLRFLRGAEHAVHVPKYKQYAMQEFWRTFRSLSTELGRTPTHEELRVVTGCSEQELGEYFSLSAHGESLDDEESRAAESLSSGGADAESLAVLASCRERLARVFGVLDEREQRIVRERFGLDGAPARTLAAIGEDFGLTKERIRQIETLACKKLLAAMDDVDLGGAPVPAELALAA